MNSTQMNKPAANDPGVAQVERLSGFHSLDELFAEGIYRDLAEGNWSNDVQQAYDKLIYNVYITTFSILGKNGEDATANLLTAQMNMLRISVNRALYFYRKAQHLDGSQAAEEGVKLIHKEREDATKATQPEVPALDSYKIDNAKAVTDLKTHLQAATQLATTNQVAFAQKLIEIAHHLLQLKVSLICGSAQTNASQKHYAAGEIALVKGKVNLSVQYLEQAIKENNSNQHALYALAGARAALLEMEEAIKHLNALSKVNMNYPLLQYQLKCLYSLGDRQQELVAMYDEIIKKESLSKGSQAPAELNCAKQKFRVGQRVGIMNGIPPILISTIPKSGSTLLIHLISRPLFVPTTKIMLEDQSFDFKPIPAAIDLFAKGGSLCRQHFLPKPELMDMLAERGVKKCLVHIRDPRQAMLSWIYYRDAVLRQNMVDFGYALVNPDGLPEWNLEQKIDYYIDNWLTKLIHFIEAWMAYDNDPNAPIDVKFTTYEGMITNKEQIVNEIFDFYGTKPTFITKGLNKLSRQTVLQKEMITKKRKGSFDEWKSLFNEQQTAKANAMISDEIISRFPEFFAG